MLLRVLFRSVILIVIFTYTLSGQSLPNYVPSNGLVGWWPFNGDTLDYVGTNDIRKNLAVFTSDRNGTTNSALSLSSTYLELPHASYLDNDDFSIAFWVNGGSTQGDRCFLKKGEYSNAFSEDYYLGLNSNNQFHIGFKGNNSCQPGQGWATATTTSASNSTSWNHIVFIHSEDTVRLYQNSLLVHKYYLSEPHGFCGNASIAFGSEWNGSKKFLNGDFDDIGFWSRGLTETEITALYSEVPASTSCSLLSSSSEVICQGDSVTLSASSTVINSNVFIDTMGQSITSNWSKVMATIPGKQYKLRVGGEFTYGTYCPSLVADPAYTKAGFYSLTSPSPRSLSSTVSGLYVLGATIGRPSPDVYNANTHTYEYYFTASGTSIEVGWNDQPLGDNCGSAGFALYEVQTAPSLLWSTGDTTSSITVTPSTSTSYWIKDGNSCYDTVNVVVNNPIIQSSAMSICSVGDSVLLWNAAGTSLMNAQSFQPCPLPLNSLQTGLAGWYPFCGNADDASTIGNDGTVQGAILTSDVFNNSNSAFSFNGQSSKIALDNPFFSGATNVSNFSIYTRFKIDVLPQSQATIFSKEGYWRTIALIVTADGEINLRGSQPSPNGYFGFKSPVNSIKPNQWYSVVYEFSNSTANCYINGSLVGTFSSPYSSFNWSYLQQGNSTSTTYFGVTEPVSPGLTNYFDGVIDDVGFWERSLTLTEIQSLSTGTVPSLTWSTGATGDSIWIKPTTSTTYWLETAIDGVTCADSIRINVSPASIVSNATELCLGDTSEISLDPLSLGTQISPISWSTGDTSSSIKVSPSQTTTYWVTNGAGCSDTAQINVNTTNFNVLPDSIVSCSTDSVLFQLSGYDSYLWSDGSVDSTNYLKNNALGSHWVQLSNGQCLGSDTSIISLGNMKVEIGNVSEITCKGYHNGSLHASVVGAQGAYQYLWSNGSTSDTIETLSAGQYWVEVTDSLGCVATDTLVLTEPAALSVAVVLDSINGYNVSCFNDRNGNGYMVPSGGEAPYTYNWNVIPTVFDSTISQLAAGNNQWAMVIDKNGCFATDTFDVLQPSPLIVSTFLIDSVSCFGGSNGAAFAQTLGGTGVSTYSWSNGFVTDTAAGLNNGAYQVVATDLNGCKAADSIKIYQPSPLTVSAVINTNFNGYGVPCAGDTIGSASVVASGSNGGFSYLWNTNTNNDTITNLAVGQYFVTVTDRKNCSMNDTVLVLEPDTLRMSIVSDTNLFGNHLDCYLDQTALVYAKSSGGAGSLAYQWSTSATNDSVFGLGAGSYWLSVSDANACSTSDTVNLFEPTALTVTAAVSSNYNGYDISCAGLSDAEVSALASGSNGGYLYVWSSGDTSSVVDSLSANNYFVTATDSLGCQSQEVVSVSNPPALSASLNSSFYNSFGVSCYGSSDGFAYVNATGGATGYTYSWNTMSSNDSITGISAGEYLVEITDLNGCVVKDSIVLSQPDSLNLILDVLTNYNGYNVSCFGASDASLNSTVSGGVPQYNYSWLFGGQVSSTSAGALGQSFGWHLLEIEDQNGCQKMDSVFVTQPDSMYSISNVISNYNGYGVRCFDSEDGIASVQTFGGAQPYLHTWNSGLPSNDTVIKNLGGGTSVLMITDANGCNSFDSVVVSVPDSIWYSSSVSNVKCFGENTGALRLVPAGGVPSYSVDWLTLATASDTIYGIGADTYSFVITDTNGCKMTDSIEVFESLQILSVLDTTMPTCAQINDGELNVSSSGGAAPYVYYVNDSLVQTPVLNLGVGQYWVKTVDSLGCSISSELFLSPQNEECFGIPNLFSPNGDSYNDSWRIRMPKDYTYEVFVYSPLGQLVFQGDEQIEWEGTYKGEGVANGDYYYVMIINNNNKINGYVTIIR